MRFREQSEDNSIPSIDLIPMLTVMMGVLAFFVVISVSLGSEQLIQVDLPSEQTEDTPTANETVQEPFIVEMDVTGQQLLNGAPVSSEQLTAEVSAYLSQNADTTVYLVPDRKPRQEERLSVLHAQRP